MNVVPFKSPEPFERAGIDWTREARTPAEKSLRETFLTHETSCSLNGLVSVLLLATVSRRQGAVAEDLQAAADFAEVILAMQLRKHQGDVLELVQSWLARGETLWE